MIVQWCVKGLSLASDMEAQAIFSQRGGLVCNWWRDETTISPSAIRDKLTPDNLDRHINHFSSPDPASGRPFEQVTPFISLSAGVVERDRAARTNNVHRARRTALRFGSAFFTKSVAYLFPCWVLIAPRSAVEVEVVGEEVRDLNSYRRYSAYQLEGEITAKVIVPDNHLYGYEKWEVDHGGGTAWRKTDTFLNPRFTPPDRLSNIRELV